MQAKVWLLEDIQRLFRNESLGADVDWEGSLSSGSSASEIEPLPRNKEGNLKDNIHIEFISCYESYESDDDIDYEGCKSKRKRSGPNTEDLTDETEEFLRAPLIWQNKEPLEWWAFKCTTYCHLAKLARKFLSCPASSIYSERLFSEAGNIFEDKRCSLLPKKGKSYYYFITT